MTDDTILMRQGVKRLPFDIFAAMKSRRQMFGTNNPHNFDYVYNDEQHYRVVLEFEQSETKEAGSGTYMLTDYTHVEYAETLSHEPNRYSMTDEDHTCMVNTLNEGPNPLFKLHAVKMAAERFTDEQFTLFDIGVIFHLGDDDYKIETSFSLAEDTIRNRPELGDGAALHQYLCTLADEVLWDKLPYLTGRYVTKSLRGEARTTLRNLMQIDSTQTRLREEQKLLWRQAEMIRPVHIIDIGMQPQKKQRRRRIDLWGNL